MIVDIKYLHCYNAFRIVFPDGRFDSFNLCCRLYSMALWFFQFMLFRVGSSQGCVLDAMVIRGTLRLRKNDSLRRCAQSPSCFIYSNSVGEVRDWCGKDLLIGMAWMKLWHVGWICLFIFCNFLFDFTAHWGFHILLFNPSFDSGVFLT